MTLMAQRRLLVREVPGMVNLPAHWRAACVLLADAFAARDDVWAHVSPGRSCDLHAFIADPGEDDDARTMLAVAQGLADGYTAVPFSRLVTLRDKHLRLVLDSLAIARGSFPID